MKLFPFRNRSEKNTSAPIPQIRVGVAHLSGPGKIRVEQEHLVFETGDTRQVRLDLEGLLEIIAYGEVHLTAAAMRLLDHHHIPLAWLSPNGCYVWGRLAHDRVDRTMTRILQYKAWDDPQWQLRTAAEIVRLKLESIVAALRHYQRQGKPCEDGVLRKLQNQIESCGRAGDADQLRGIEGNATALWFKQYGEYFGRNWKFTTRIVAPLKIRSMPY